MQIIKILAVETLPNTTRKYLVFEYMIVTLLQLKVKIQLYPS